MLVQKGHLSWCPTLEEPCHCKTAGYVLVTFLALAVALFEFWGSLVSGSLSLLGDAWHVSSDVVVYLVAIWANISTLKNGQAVSEIKKTWARRNANVLIFVALTIIVSSFWRMFHPTEVVTSVMISVTAVGLAVNVLMYFILSKFKIEHEHGDEDPRHDHLHDTTLQHTILDTGISVSVLITGGLIRWFPETNSLRLDSVASVAICAVLIMTAQKTRSKAQNH